LSHTLCLWVWSTHRIRKLFVRLRSSMTMSTERAPLLRRVSISAVALPRATHAPGPLHNPCSTRHRMQHDTMPLPSHAPPRLSDHHNTHRVGFRSACLLRIHRPRAVHGAYAGTLSSRVVMIIFSRSAVSSVLQFGHLHSSVSLGGVGGPARPSVRTLKRSPK